MSLLRTWLFVSLLAAAGCKSSSPGTGPADEQDSGGVPASDGSNGTDDATVVGTADAGSARDASDAGPVDAGGAGPATKSGVDTYSGRLCGHEQSCGLIDAGATSLDGCKSALQAFYEASGNSAYGTMPPLELYRADYVNALGACIASAPCSEAITTSEARCSAQLLSPTDAGPAEIAPTAALMAACRAFQASPCLAADSGAQDCTLTLELFSDSTLQTAGACFSSSSCATVNSCFASALTQP